MTTRLVTNAVRILATVMLLVWAAFWLWFCGAVLVSEWDGTVPWEPVLKIVLPIVVLTGFGLAAPRIGGMLFIPASIFTAWYFDNGWTLLLAALPMFVIGAALVLTGPWVRSLVRRSEQQRPAQAGREMGD